jgi:hypothetical protein
MLSVPIRLLIPLWLFGRALLRHLLLILLYAGLGADAFEAVGIVGWGVFALLGAAFGVVGTVVTWRRHYPRRKLLWVHGVGGLTGIAATALHPLGSMPALVLTLALVALPCRDCIRLTLPVQEAR